MTAVSDNVANHRFEMKVHDETAFIDYAMEDGRLVLIHTEVPQALGGLGIGSALVRAVLIEARDRGLQIIPKCEFVQKYIRRNPEFADLVVRSVDEH